MPQIMKALRPIIQETTNENVNIDPGIPRHMCMYITTDVDERPQQQNEVDMCTVRLAYPSVKIVFSITNEPTEDFDLAPELTVEEAATLAKRFFKNPPINIVDSELDSGF